MKAGCDNAALQGTQQTLTFEMQDSQIKPAINRSTILNDESNVHCYDQTQF